MKDLPSYVYYLLLGQGINLISAVLSVTVSAIVGLSLAPHISYATIPYGLQFFAILISTLLFSKLMKTYGRYPIFITGIFCLFISGILGYISLSYSSFYLFCLTHFFLGLFISTANFYRFAATDGLNKDLVPKATSIVISGGVLAAIIAPLLAIELENIHGMPKYSCIYLTLTVLSLILFFVINSWHKRFKKSINYNTEKNNNSSINQDDKYNKPLIIIGFIGGSLGYYLMNLMMIVFSLFLKTNHSFHFASSAIQLHVLAMFLPSFFAPKLIKTIGSTNTVILGFLLIGLSSTIPLIFNDPIFLKLSLIILGLGWNFCYSAGSTLVGSVSGSNRIKIQGINETGIALFATLGAFLPAPILAALGWENTNIMAILFCFLIILMILGFKLLSLKEHKSNATN